MAKFLVFVAIIVLIWFLARATRRKPKPPPAAAPEAMVGCARCGVHFPAAESFRSGGLDYCSEEHRRLGAGS